MAKQLNAPARRTFVSAINAAARRPAAAKAAVAVSQQTRGVKTIDFAGTKEKVFGKPFQYISSRRGRWLTLLKQSVPTGLPQSSR